jgi:hypothetical protein
MKRRSFLQVLGGAPFAAKQVAIKGMDHLTAGGPAPSMSPILDHLPGVMSGAAQGGYNETNPTPPRWKMITKEAARDALRGALKKPEQLREIKALLYEQHRTVYVMDPDLLYNKSFSPAAKIAYQRQRIVERALEFELNGQQSTWENLRTKIMKIVIPDWLQ